jgi:glycosyltransferase involved in cell wall biosynthesis
MRVLLDATRIVGRRLRGRFATGVDRVTLAYLRGFGAEAALLLRWGGRWLELGAADSARLAAALDGDAPRRVAAAAWRGAVAAWAGLPRPSQGLRPFLALDHHGLDRPGYGARLARLGARPVFFLHDLIPLTHPEYGRPGEAARHARRVATMLDTPGARLIVNSAATRAALAAHAAAQGRRMPPCLVAPLAPPDWPDAAAMPPPLPDPYFVMLGTIEPRKNHLLLLQLWRALAAAAASAPGAPPPPRLLLVGQRGWECEQVLDLLERCPALAGSVVERPRLDDAALAAAIRGARALLLPSFAEGFGLPVVEALSLGTPVLASDLPVFREVAGDIPDYLDPLDGPGWRDAILAYAAPDHPRRAAQRARLAGFVPPRWQAHLAAARGFIAAP